MHQGDDRGPAEPGTGDATGVRVAAVGLGATALLAAVAAGLAAALGSFVAAGAAAHLVASLPVWLALLVHEVRAGQARAAALEARRLAALAAEGRRAIFADPADGGGAARGDAAAALERARGLGGAVAALATAGLELAAVWTLLTLFPRAGAAATLPAAAALCGGAFGLLVIGRYAAALARAGASPEVAAGGRRATSGALLLLVAGLTLAAAHATGQPALDLAGHGFVAVSALLGLEALLLLLLEAYRPRRPGEVARPVFDSRLLGLVAAPGDMARSIARTVDYQFGFALSQTWFYRFLERWVAPIAGFALVVLWALSSVVVVAPHERALVRRLGTLREGVLLPPGASLKLPWPFDEAVLVPQERVQSFMTGDHEVGALAPGARERAVLWTERHDAEDDDHHGHARDLGEDADMLVLLARRGAEGEDAVNLLATAATIAFRVRDPRAFATAVDDPRALLGCLAERELSFMLSGSDLDELLVERGPLAATLRARLQAAADDLGLGVEVTSAYLTELHPPPEVGRSFEAVTEALEQREARILEAAAHAARLAPAARAEADRVRDAARVAARGRVALARADADRFAAQRLLDRAAPGVYRMHLLLRALADGSGDARKVVVGRGADVTTDLNLEERISAEQLNLGAGFAEPATEGKGR